MPEQPLQGREHRSVNLNDRDREAIIKDLYAIRLEAETIAAHRDEPCQFWTGHGCEMAMVVNAVEIMRLVDRLLPEEAER